MFTAVAALVVAASPACGPLDLDTALSMAAARNDEVAIRQAELESARADVAVASALRIVPDAHATFLIGPAPAARGDVVSSPDSNRHPLRNVAPFERVEVDVVQPLFTWGRLDGASDAAQASVEARSLMVQDDLARVQERIVRLFWADALARRLLVIAADVERALVEADRRVARSLERADGEITPSDRYRIALFRGSVLQRAADARRGLGLTQAGLAATLSLPLERLSLKETPLEVHDEAIPSADEARLRAEASRRDLKALGFAIAAKEAQVRVDESAALPQIFVGGRLAYSHAPNRDLQVNPWVLDYFNEFVAGFAVGVRQDLAFPLLAAKSRKTRAEKAALERRRDALAELVTAEVNGALADLRAAVDRLEAARGTSSSGKSWFRAASLDFSAGLIDPRDLVEAYAGYVESQGWLAQASYDVLVARGRLALVTGALPVPGEPKCELQ